MPSLFMSGGSFVDLGVFRRCFGLRWGGTRLLHAVDDVLEGVCNICRFDNFCGIIARFIAAYAADG